jgi:Uncharacterized conserved protein (some members contain a von Willebrand factor type A (vWA) domain)
MDLSSLRQLFSIRDVRNAAMGMIVVFGGLTLAGLTLFGHQTGNQRLAGIAAGLSLVFVLLILIFVVPPLARSASKEASQLNLPFEFTLGGAIMLGLIAIVGFSAWNTGNNLLFLVFSFLVAAMVVGFVAGSITLKRLEVKMRFPETIFAGEKTTVLVSLHNRKRWFSSNSVVAEVRGTYRSESSAADDLRKLLPKIIADRLTKPPVVRRTLDYFIYVARNHAAETKTQHIFENRGRLVIKDFELSTKYPFAFFRHRRRLPARETELVVLPKLEPYIPDLSEMNVDAGKLVANKRGSGQELLSLRAYRVNDDMRRVDWKATARTNEIVVREFSAEDDKKITIYFDPRVPQSSRNKMTLRAKIEAEQAGNDVLHSDRFEHGISRTASLINDLTDDQAEIRLAIGDEIGEYGIGSRHLYECLKRLALIEPRFIERVSDIDTSAEVVELFDETELSHNYIVAAIGESAFPAEILQEAVFVRY